MGTREGTTASSAVRDLVEHYFTEAGLSVRHDRPFRGGWTTALHGRPEEGIHAVQIELNRDLYIDERNLEPKVQGLGRLQGIVEGLVRGLADLELADPMR